MACLTDEGKAVIERFEQAVATMAYHQTHIDEDGETDEESYSEAKTEYLAAKTEIEMWMAWVP